MSLLRLLLLSSLLLAFPAAATAGGYVGGSIGKASLEISDEDLDFDEDDTGYKIFGGYRFLKFFAVEGGYVDFGNPSGRVGRFDVDAEVDGWHAFARGIIPLGLIELHAKAGLIMWDGDLTAERRGKTLREGDDGTDAAYGVGIALDLSKFAIRLEAEKFDAGDIDDLFMVSAGVEIRF